MNFLAKRPEADVGTPVLPLYHQALPAKKARRRRNRRLAGLSVLAFLYGMFFAFLPPAFLLYLLIPLIILLGFAIWSLPVTERPPSRLLIPLFWGFWLSKYLWPNYLAIALPGLPWITMSRLFGAPLILLLLLATSQSAPFRRTMKDILSASPWLWKSIAAFAVVQLVSNIFSSNLGISLNKFVNFQIIWTGIFFVSVYAFHKPKRIELWAHLFVAMAIILSLIGLVEAQQQKILWVGHIPSFLKIEDPSVQRLLDGVFRLGSVYRIAATTDNPLALAEFLALSTPLLIFFFLRSRKLIVWAALIAADLLIFSAIIYTDARLGFVGFVISHFSYGLFWAVRRWRRHRDSIVGPALALAYPALIGVFIVAALTVQRIRVRILGDGRHQYSNDARWAQFWDTWPELAKSPLFGFGPGQGAGRLNYTNPGGTLTIDSYFLSIALDYGVIGFLLYYGMTVTGLIKAARIAATSRSVESEIAVPVALCLTIFLVTKIVLSLEGNNSILFMLLAIVAVLAYREQQNGPSAGPLPRPGTAPA